MHPYVQWSNIFNSQGMEATWVSVNRWMDREDTVHLYNRILLGHKKNEILPYVTAWMDLEGIMLSEKSETEQDKYHMISLICCIWKSK